MSPSIHSVEWRERRGRIVPAAALLAVGGLILGSWIGLFGFLSSNPPAAAVEWFDETYIPETAPSDIPEFPNLSRLSSLYSADNVQLAELSLRGSLPVPYEQIPQVVAGAIVAAEDGDFFTHRGADFESITRAFFANIQNESIQGGSTITQQVVRNLGVVGRERTIERKLKEITYAAEMERKYSKEAILEFYANSVYFGWNAYGIRAAGLEYFGKDLAQLTVGEAATLATLIRNPSLYDPRNTSRSSGPSGRELVQERRNDVLDEMVELEYITEAEAEAARSTSVESTLIPHRRFDEPAEQIRIAAVRTLLNDPAFDNVLGVTEQQRLVSIFGCPADDEECELRPGLKGGLRVVTTVDWAAQEMANELLRRWFPQPADGTKAPTGAITTVENRTGAIRVMAGGLDFGDDFDAGQRDYDLALEGQRQPGSAFKPFALIAYLEQGGSLNSYWNMTSPQELECGFPCGPAGEFVWRVRGGRLDGGLRSLEAATYFSTNTVYAQVALAVGGTGIANTAHRLGVESTLPEVPGLALGVGEVSPLDMAAAYSTVANYGTRYEPYLIERIEGENGDVLWAAAPQPEEVLDPVLAATVVDVLKKVVSVNGATGTAANIGRPQAGKTGTTQSFRDAWFVGFVPQYSTAVWAGYADELIAMQNITINGNFYDKVFGGSVPAPIWREFMSEYLADVPVEDFGPIPGDNRRYRSLPQTEVPDLTGLLEREAKNEVYSAHLNPAFEPVDSLEPEGTILSQTPEPGARMNHNGTVTIEISTGLPPTVPLPSLIGMTRTEANQIAAEIAAESNILLNLVPQFTVTEPESWNLIVATLPPAGTPVGVDDVITIVIGKAPDA